MIKPDHTFSNTIDSMYEIPFAKRLQLSSMARRLEHEIHRLKRELDSAARQVKAAEDERDKTIKRLAHQAALRRNLEQSNHDLCEALKPFQAEHERRVQERLHRQVGTEAPMFSHGMDNRTSEPPPPRDHLEGWLDPKATHDPR